MVDIEVEMNFDIDEVSEELESWIEELKENSNGAVIFEAPYAAYVNYDTSYSSAPPFQPLRKWVFYKWGRLSDSLKEAARSKNMESGSEKHMDAVTYMIMNSFEDGKTIEGVFFVEDTLVKFSTNIEDYEEIFQESPEEFMKTLLEDMKENSQEILREEDKVATGTLHDSAVTEIDTEPIVE